MPRPKGIYHWITNGIKSKQVPVVDDVPFGWHHGRTVIPKEIELMCEECSLIFVSTKKKKGDDGKIRCKGCARKKAQDRHLPKQRNKWLTETYGITLEEYEDLLESQNYVCAICKQPEKKLTERKDRSAFLSVDHDHETGKIRGLLCNSCNVGLGHLAENKITMRSAISYLIAHSSIPSWDEYFMDIALMASTRSKDPSTKVGAIIVKDKKIISTGYNGLPRQLNDLNPEYWKRPEKYVLVIHAEQNAIIQAQGTSLQGATMYCTLFPCVECAKSIIQAGIKEVAYQNLNNPRFRESFDKSKKILEECNVTVRQYLGE